MTNYQTKNRKFNFNNQLNVILQSIKIKIICQMRDKLKGIIKILIYCRQTLHYWKILEKFQGKIRSS